MKTIWIILLSLCVGALLSTMLMRSCQTPQIERVEIVKTDTLTITKVDTIEIVKPQPYKVEVRDTVYIEKGYAGHVFVQETKWFGDNSTYDMQVSGINVQLDWINIYPKTVIQYITEKEIIYAQPQKWSLWANGEIGSICGKPSLPVGAKLKYVKDQNREYYLKGGTDLLNGGSYILGGVDVKLF